MFVFCFHLIVISFFFSSRRRHTRSVSAFLLNRSSDLDRLEAFYDNPNALRDYFRDIGRMVLAAEGRKANDSHADCYQYFCVPEYGTANGRLHFHAVHFMRTLPTGSVDPNFGRRVDRKSGSAGMPRPISYAVFCLKKKTLRPGEFDARNYYPARRDPATPVSGQH